MWIKKEAHSDEVEALAPVFKKSATEHKLKQKLLKCKSTIQIATFNVRTLNIIGQLPELTASSIHHIVDILCIQEHRYLHSVYNKYHNTGFCIEKSITGVIEGISMMAVMFNGNPSTTIISCYSLTNVSDETDLIVLYKIVRSILKHNVLIIGGDMNAQMGKNVKNKFSLQKLSNRYGEHLAVSTLKNRLTCLNTKFQKRKQWTYPNVKNAKARINYILINKKWYNSALNCEVYSSFEGVSSDHRIVTAKIRLNLRRNAARTTTTVQYDWSLLNNGDIKDKYTLTRRNKVNALQKRNTNSECRIWELRKRSLRSGSRLQTNKTKS